MPIRNQHWYNANEGRAYPLDDTATQLSDAGVRLPSSIIADLNLRWPVTLGRYAFISAVTNAAALVTVTIQAADTIDSAGAFTPLAVLTIPKPITLGRMYAVQAQLAGVGGWVVFGSGCTEANFRGLFSSPSQSLLTVRAAKAYAPLPVTSLQALNAATALTGVVLLKASQPLEITKEERFIAGANRDCIVIRLIDENNSNAFPVPSDVTAFSEFKPRSLFQDFAGPCAGRPESSTCGCPEPIQFVNAVAPDCDGVLTVELRGCAQVATMPSSDGIAIGCDFSLDEACVPRPIPASDGMLPSEADPVNVPDPPPPPPPDDDDTVSDSFVFDTGLPYVECFLNANTVLTAVAGKWSFVSDDNPTGMCATEESFPVSESLSQSVSRSLSTSVLVLPDYSYYASVLAGRNTAIFDVDVSSVYRRATTELKIVNVRRGASRNAHLVINYRPHASLPGQYVFFAAEVNYDTQEFRLLRFNGSSFITIADASVTAPGIQLDKWYRVTASCRPFDASSTVLITIRLEAITDPGVLDLQLQVNVNNYQPSVGKFGIGTNMANAEFSYLRIDEELP